MSGRVLVFILLLIAGACSGRALYEQNRSVGGGWDRSNPVRFEVSVSSPWQSHPVFVVVRNDGSYPYSNLWLFLSVERPDGLVDRDTVEISLARPSGQWTGKRVAGLYESRLMWKDAYIFRDTGNYVFTCEQAMRDVELKGIRNVGLRVGLIE